MEVDESRALGGAVARASPLPGLYICPCLAVNAINALEIICYQSCPETNETAVSKPPHQTWTNIPLEFFFRTGVPSFPVKTKEALRFSRCKPSSWNVQPPSHIPPTPHTTPLTLRVTKPLRPRTSRFHSHPVHILHHETICTLIASHLALSSSSPQRLRISSPATMRPLQNQPQHHHSSPTNTLPLPPCHPPGALSESRHPNHLSIKTLPYPTLHHHITAATANARTRHARCLLPFPSVARGPRPRTPQLWLPRLPPPKLAGRGRSNSSLPVPWSPWPRRTHPVAMARVSTPIAKALPQRIPNSAKKW
ncbi:hypothetical protein M758_1G247400 [Ceratodon purpureus]|nr:hypothetical protein M758_1G247400 [Ceratodon purpureus]